MVSNDFSEQQKDFLKDFLSVSSRGINKKKISPSYLLYIISKVSNKDKKDIYTKVNKVLLRDMLPKKKRLFLDSLIRDLLN